MLAALVVASWMAQAEAAPAEAPPPPPPTAPAVEVPSPAPPSNALTVQARFAYRVGAQAVALGPRVGFSLGATFEHRYALIGEVLELGGAVDFSYDHFQLGVQGSSMVTPGAPEQTYDAQRVITQTSFALLQTIGARRGAVHVWAGLGGGMSVAYFSSPELELRPGHASGLEPLVRGAVAFDVTVRERTAIVLRADYTHTFNRPSFTSDLNQSYTPFGDLFDVGLGLLVRF
jgi:hypothetical protein